MRPATDIVKGVLQTEKSARIGAHDQFLLEVAVDANKTEIRRRRLQARWGRRVDRKKAIVTLAKGQKIEVKT
jgi:ribosomal protein L23